MSRVVPYPKGSGEYLQRKYGIQPYSDKHTDRLVQKGLYPKPIAVSPRRRVSRIEDLDNYAQGLLQPQ